MSRADDMRCLYCEGKLPLFRRMTNGQFCSAGHRTAYWQEQEQLAVERLHQTHNSLQAYRSMEAPAPAAGHIPASESFSPNRFQAEQPIAPSRESQDRAGSDAFVRSAANRGEVTIAGFVADATPLPHVDRTIRFSQVDFLPWSPGRLGIPAYGRGVIAGALENAGIVTIPVFASAKTVPHLRTPLGHDAPVEFGPQAAAGISLVAAPQTPEFEPRLAEKPVEPAPCEDPELPLAKSLFALPRIAARSAAVAPRVESAKVLHTQLRVEEASWDGLVLAPAMVAATKQLPLCWPARPQLAQGPLRREALQAVEFTVRMDAPRAAMGLALGIALGRRYPIPYRTVGRQTGSPAPGKVAARVAVQPVDVRADVTGSPYKESCTQGLELVLNLASACRYPVSIQARQMTASTIHETAVVPQEFGKKVEIVPLPQGLGQAEGLLVRQGVVPLAFRGVARVPEPARPVAGGVLNEYPVHLPMQPVLDLHPVEGEAVPASRLGMLAGWARNLTGSGEGTNILTHAADFWKHAPRDLKMLVVAIPILLGLVLRPSLPKVRVTAPAAQTQIPGSLEQGVRAQLMNVRRTVARRAGVALNEEFRSGLDDWQSRSDLSTAWSFDSSGFVRPGPLALYRPSMGLTNYELQFLAMVNKQALSWVVRAADFDNYYVVKLVVLKQGPVPTMGITRYAVIAGKAQDRVDKVAPINARPDTLYRVDLNVNDDTYLLMLQGVVVDSWTDSRLKTGGIGFFSPRGEESRLRWVQVTHQYDMLGRLCAFLAPYNISTTNGSW